MEEENNPKILQMAVIEMDRGIWSAKLKKLLCEAYGYPKLSDEDSLILHCGCGSACALNPTRGRCTCVWSD